MEIITHNNELSFIHHFVASEKICLFFSNLGTKYTDLNYDKLLFYWSYDLQLEDKQIKTTAFRKKFILWCYFY